MVLLGAPKIRLVWSVCVSVCLCARERLSAVPNGEWLSVTACAHRVCWMQTTPIPPTHMSSARSLHVSAIEIVHACSRARPSSTRTSQCFRVARARHPCNHTESYTAILHLCMTAHVCFCVVHYRQQTRHGFGVQAHSGIRANPCSVKLLNYTRNTRRRERENITHTCRHFRSAAHS